MSKKGMLIATFTAVALLIAIAVLASLGDKARVRPDVSYLGQEEVKVYSAYYLAEEEMLYLEQGAKLSASDAKSADEFREAFGEYLGLFNARYNQTLSLDDLQLKFDKDILVFSDKELLIRDGNMEYRFKPRFRIANPGIVGVVESVPLK